MSFLFGDGRPQPSSAEKIAAAEAEIEMVSNMFNQYISPTQTTLCSILTPCHRLVDTCTKKCIPPQYREADLNKGRVRLPRPLRG